MRLQFLKAARTLLSVSPLIHHLGGRRAAAAAGRPGGTEFSAD